MQAIFLFAANQSHSVKPTKGKKLVLNKTAHTWSISNNIGFYAPTVMSRLNVVNPKTHMVSTAITL